MCVPLHPLVRGSPGATQRGVYSRKSFTCKLFARKTLLTVADYKERKKRTEIFKNVPLFERYLPEELEAFLDYFSEGF